MSSASTPIDWRPADAPTVPCIWFYIPLRRPLRLPNEYILRVGDRSPYAPAWPPTDFTEVISLAGPLDNPVEVTVSICVRQIERTATDHETDAMLAASLRNRPQGTSATPPVLPSKFETVTTVLECATSLGAMTPAEIQALRDGQSIESAMGLQSTHVGANGDSSDDPLTTALDKVTEAYEKVVRNVNHILRSYSMATRHPVALVKKANLPGFVLAEWSPRGAVGPGEIDAKEGLFFCVNPQAHHLMSRAATHSDDLPEEQISTMLEYADVAGRSPLADVYSMLWDAKSARRAGDYAVSVVLLAAGYEMLMRRLLPMLLWEEDMPPKDAISKMYQPKGRNHGIAKIMQSQVGHRLGGDWDTRSSSGTVGCFYKAVFGRRNSYVHAAAPIAWADANDAFDAAHGFMEFLVERLKDRCCDYPFTALMGIGEPLVTELNLDERIYPALRDRESQLAWSLVAPDCLAHFIMYQEEIRRLQERGVCAGKKETGKITDQTHTAALIYPDNTVEYWLVDPDGGTACRSALPDLHPKATRHFNRYTRRLRRQPRPNNVLLAYGFLGTLAQPIDSPPEWVPLYEVWRMEHQSTRQ